MDMIELNTPADDRLAIEIREALRDRQAQAARQPTGQAIRPQSYADAVLAAGAL